MSAITASVAERWSPSRIATGLVLGAWGAMFWVLWLTDRKGHQVGVAVDKLAYVDLGTSSEHGRIGFGAP